MTLPLHEWSLPAADTLDLESLHVILTALVREELVRYAGIHLFLARRAPECFLRKASFTAAITARHLAGISEQETTEHTLVALQLLLVDRKAILVENCRLTYFIAMAGWLRHDERGLKEGALVHTRAPWSTGRVGLFPALGRYRCPVL